MPRIDGHDDDDNDDKENEQGAESDEDSQDEDPSDENNDPSSQTPHKRKTKAKMSTRGYPKSKKIKTNASRNRYLTSTPRGTSTAAAPLAVHLTPNSTGGDIMGEALREGRKLARTQIHENRTVTSTVQGVGAASTRTAIVEQCVFNN